MSKNLKLVVFIIIMGTITSVLLQGTYTLTKDRIAENADIKLKSAVLDGFDIAYTTSNIHDVFDSEVTIINHTDDVNGSFTFYVDDQTGAIAFEYAGGGVWDEISGVLTLESDLVTIQKVAVLAQAETPGLGAIVATDDYLANFVGIKMMPQLEINKDDAENKENEVDTITGATRTSKAFENMLNLTYATAMDIWELESYGGSNS